MLRIIYAVTVALISGSAVTTEGIDRDARVERGAAIAMLASMQR